MNCISYVYTKGRKKKLHTNVKDKIAYSIKFLRVCTAQEQDASLFHTPLTKDYFLFDYYPHKNEKK